MVTKTKKIFVGGLSAPTTLEDVKSYFEQFGKVIFAPFSCCTAYDFSCSKVSLS
jgi:RNA recognition motif-containing protein